MSRGKKKSLRKKEVNLTTLEIGVRKYMQERPLYGDDFKRNERISNIFKKGQRRFRKEGSFISR